MLFLQDECERVILDTLYGFLENVSSQKDPIKKRKLQKEYITFMNNIVRQTLEASLSDNSEELCSSESVNSRFAGINTTQPQLRSASGNIRFGGVKFKEEILNLSEMYVKEVLKIRRLFEKL